MVRRKGVNQGKRKSPSCDAALFLSACDDEQECLANQQRDDSRAEHDEEVAEQDERIVERGA